MAEAQGTFSESWYRICERRISLRPYVRITRQMYRGERWHVISDPFGNQFFRLRPAVYEFVARLSSEKTVQEVWDECLDLFPNDAPGQPEIIRLLAQLFHSNLIQSDQPADSAQLFERHRKRREQETRSRLLNIMFARFHLIDPDRFLRRTLPFVRPIFGRIGAALWLLVVAGGIKALVDNAPDLFDQTQAVLAPGNLALLYLALVLLKTLHEFGHAYVCRYFGGEVHDMGVMLLIFTPLPYVNATAAWSFRERWKRVLVGASGIMVEVFIAGIAAMVWAVTGSGTLNALAYNMVFIASVSTVLFNGNPLLRYDGYYILSDLIDQPNLHTRATGVWKHLIERRGFGMRDGVATENPAGSASDAVGLAIFAALSGVYRIIVFGGILLFVGSRFLLIGVIMAVICAVSWILTPIFKLFRYIAQEPRLHRTRGRAAGVLAAAIAIVLFIFGVLPFPVSVVAPGMVQAVEHAKVAGESAGFLREIIAQPGTWVEEGQPLVRLDDPELHYSLEQARAQLLETQALMRQALDTQPANIEPLARSIEVLQARIADIESRIDSLTVRARHEGLWVASEIEELHGVWVARGAVLGDIVDTREMRFLAVIGQNEAARVFGEEPRRASVKLRGQAARRIPVALVTVLPGERTRLSSPALGWTGGGEIAVDPRDPDGLNTTEPFFEMRAHLDNYAERVALAHGHTGRIRFVFKSEPLMRQWTHKLRQLIQKRYQL